MPRRPELLTSKAHLILNYISGTKLAALPQPHRTFARRPASKPRRMRSQRAPFGSEQPVME
jgi:hypothetical protein